MGEYRAARSVGGADLGDGGGVAAELVGGDEVFVDGLYRLLQLCNKIAIIKNGELVVSGETSELTHGKSLEEAVRMPNGWPKWTNRSKRC